jgi:hypothetical protein
MRFRKRSMSQLQTALTQNNNFSQSLVDFGIADLIVEARILPQARDQVHAKHVLPLRLSHRAEQFSAMWTQSHDVN